MSVKLAAQIPSESVSASLKFYKQYVPEQFNDRRNCLILSDI